ncbi:hypothetical protein TorRG33x02_325260 [Trema orientale]|uniref:Uncharacterized protein n=1 Tax=Trema orientale TaxID=63057 RepID=A0A2P5BD66_TREOI|nr:hypothetical protein TorRG33x02_325260 [Trema orientale]
MSNEDHSKTNKQLLYLSVLNLVQARPVSNDANPNSFHLMPVRGSQWSWTRSAGGSRSESNKRTHKSFS